MESVRYAPCRKWFDEALVKQVLEQMMTHHDALRLVYPIEEGRIIQRHRGVDENDVAVEVIEVQGERSQQNPAGRKASK